MATVAVRVSPRDFVRGVQAAKRMGGTFDGATKLWQIPADRPELGALAAYGLVLAAPTIVTTITIRLANGTVKQIERDGHFGHDRRVEFTASCQEKGVAVLDYSERRFGYCTTCEGPCDNSHPDY